MKVHNVAQALQQCINIKPLCLNYILKIRNTNSRLLQVFIGVYAKIDNVTEY